MSRIASKRRRNVNSGTASGTNKYFILGLLETLPAKPVLIIHMANKKEKEPPRVGRTPDIMRKGGPMKDRSKYDRKPKHKRRNYGPENHD